MAKFVCWKDGTDLTQAVFDDTPGTVVLGGAGEGKPPSGWRVVVTCPADKCENIFDSQIVAAHGDNATIVGAPPSIGDTFLLEAAKEIAPAKSLTRAGDAAKFTIERISLVALVLGGFGMFTDLGGGFAEHPKLFGAVVLAAATALLLAVYALFPQVDRNVNLSDLNQVDKSYTDAINHRARWAQASSLALLAAVGLALWAFFEVGGKDPDATITTAWDGSGDRGVLSFTVEMKDLPADSTPSVRLIGLKNAEDDEGEQLALTTAKRGSDGGAKVDDKFVPPTGFAAFRVEAAVSWDGGDETMTESATIDPPPFDAPKPQTLAQGKSAGNNAGAQTSDKRPGDE